MKRMALAMIFAAILLAQDEPDLRGIWQVQNMANVNLEAPAGKSVIVDPGNGKIPYRPDALVTRQENFKNRLTADPQAKCFQAGVPRATYTPKPFQIFQSPKRVFIVYQDVHAYRVIFTDGRPHYDSGIEFYMGDSRGHWEGDTLVVDVTNFKDETWLDMAGNYHSDALHVVERYTRSGRETLTYEATIEDPKVFTRPWKIRMPLRLHTEPGFQILEDECVEDERGNRRHASPFRSKN
jgi:hypothetical protein